MDNASLLILIAAALAIFAANNYLSDPDEVGGDLWKSDWIGPTQDLKTDAEGKVTMAEDDIYLRDTDPRPWDAYASYSDYIDHGWVPVKSQLGDGWIRWGEDHKYYDGTHYTNLNNMYFVRTGRDSSWREISKTEYDDRSPRDSTLQHGAWSLENKSADSVGVVSELNRAWLTEWKPPKRNYLKGVRGRKQYIFDLARGDTLVHDIPLAPLAVDYKPWYD